MRVTLTLIALSSALGSAAAQTNAPPDKPQTVRGKEALEAYERAIAPYVAKARASYPAAKKRYLAGLPRGYAFTVFTRLCQSADRSHHEQCEDLYVIVDGIEDGKIYGRVNNRPRRETIVFISPNVTRAVAEQVTLIVGRGTDVIPGINGRAVALQCVSLCRTAVIAERRELWVNAGLVARGSKAIRSLRIADEIVAQRREIAHGVWRKRGGVSGDDGVGDVKC